MSDATRVPPITTKDLAQAAGAAGRLLGSLLGKKGGSK